MIIGINRLIGIVEMGGRRLHSIRLRHHNQFMEMLHVPAGIHQFDRQPVEQFMVQWLRCPKPEIINRSDQRLAKVPSPDLIDGDPCCQRIAAIGDPARQCQPTTSAGLRVGSGTGVFAIGRFGAGVFQFARFVIGGQGLPRFLLGGSSLLAGGSQLFP